MLHTGRGGGRTGEPIGRVSGRIGDQDGQGGDRALGWLLEEINMTWAHLEKKRTRLQLYTKSDEENSHTVAGNGVTVFREGVRISQRCQDFL
ncbi:hypothetical protein Tco_1450935 [Tanacetum coccineum]